MAAAAATTTAVVRSSNSKPAAAAAAAPPLTTATTPTPTPKPLSLATSDDVAALKRLLREAFEAQLHARTRLDALERERDAAERRRADLPEAGDEVVPSAKGVSYAPGARERDGLVRVTGGAGCRGILVWRNGGGGGGGDGGQASSSSATTAASATLRALGASADAGVSVCVHHHSPAGRRAGGLDGNGTTAKQAAATAGGDDSEQAAAPLDATPLGAAATGDSSGSSPGRRSKRRQQQTTPWYSRDRRITLRLATGPRACDDEDGGAPILVAAGGGEQASSAAADNANDALPSLSPRQLLVRLRPADWLQFLVAPLGGSLASLARPPAPLLAASSAARSPCPAATRALRRGHDLTALRCGGVGKAVAVSRGALSLAVGHFAAAVVGGDDEGVGQGGEGESAAGGQRPGRLLRATTAAQLALHPRDGESAVALSLARMAVGAMNEGGGYNTTAASPIFLGASAPGFSSELSRAMLMPWLPAAGSEARRSVVAGASWSAPVGDALAATAWAERRLVGRAEDASGGGGWGVTLRTRAAEAEEGGGGGPELAVALARASTATAGGGGRGGKDKNKGPLYCEVSARLCGGEGISVSPGMVVTLGGDAPPLVAYTIAGAWRF
jgi:hypothetical protein